MSYNSGKITDALESYFSSIFIDDTRGSKHALQDTVDKEMQKYISQTHTTPSSIKLEKEFTSTEVTEALNDLKKGRSPSHDNVSNEHLIYGKKPISSALVVLYNSILRQETIPDSWRSSLIIPIYKGNGKPKNDPTSYRPVSLVPTLCKVFEKLLMKYSCSLFSDRIFPSPQQQGFQPGLSCITTAFCLQEAIYDIANLNSQAFVAFLDFKSAFDSVWHDALLTKLYKIGVTGKVWRTISDSYRNLECRVVVNGNKSRQIPVTCGVRQGSVASTF